MSFRSSVTVTFLGSFAAAFGLLVALSCLLSVAGCGQVEDFDQDGNFRDDDTTSLLASCEFGEECNSTAVTETFCGYVPGYDGPICTQNCSREYGTLASTLPSVGDCLDASAFCHGGCCQVTSIEKDSGGWVTAKGLCAPGTVTEDYDDGHGNEASCGFAEKGCDGGCIPEDADCCYSGIGLYCSSGECRPTASADKGYACFADDETSCGYGEKRCDSGGESVR